MKKTTLSAKVWSEVKPTFRVLLRRTTRMVAPVVWQLLCELLEWFRHEL
jgi:hypothetical protein